MMVEVTGLGNFDQDRRNSIFSLTRESGDLDPRRKDNQYKDNQYEEYI